MPKNDNPNALRFVQSMTKHGQQEAAEQFAGEHPLSKSADARKKAEWAKHLCAFLEERYDDETVQEIRMDCACGPYGMNGKLKKIYEKTGDPEAFVKEVNGLDMGFTFEYDGTSYTVVYPQCYCSCVKKMEEKLPRAWCYCTLGFNRTLFETVLGQEVRGELVSSIKQGDETCRIRITPVPKNG